MRLLMTGGAGFVGNHFVEHALKNSGHEIVLWTVQHPEWLHG